MRAGSGSQDRPAALLAAGQRAVRRAHPRGLHRYTAPFVSRWAHNHPDDGPQRRMSSFFTRRWRGQVPMRTLFWRDMLGIGTAVNVLATFAGLIAASQGAATWIAVAMHFMPLPYNLFLCAAVHRMRPRSSAANLVAMGWLAVMTLV